MNELIQQRTTKYDSLVLAKKDYEMILKHRHMNHLIEDYSHKDALETLEEKMEDASFLDFEDMPEDIVRLYSWVTVASASEWRQTFLMVLPYEMDIKRNRLSVQSALGASVIGLSEGETFNYGTPIGSIPLLIEKVEQSHGQIKEYISEDVLNEMLPKI